MNAKELITCFEEATSLVALCDAHGAIVACNAALSALTGPMAGSSIPSWSHLLSSPSFKELHGSVRSCLRGEPPFPVDADIGESSYELRVNRLTGCDDAALIVTGHNQTLKKRREEYVFTTRSMRSMAELTNRIAHDMNNVLSGALGFSSYLQTKFEKGSDVQKQLALIESSALRGHEITQQLLAFSRRRPEVGGQVKVADVVRDVSLDLSKQRDVTILVGKPDEMPPLPGNPDKIRTALSSVILNACEAQKSGARKLPVQVTVEYRELSGQERYVFNRLADSRHYACITVADHGTGIPSHIQARVYEPYVTTKPLGESSGLGLAVTHSIVDDHEGMLSITHEAEITYARIYLPFREHAAERPAQGPTSSAPSKIQGSETILVIDDEIIIRRLLSDLMPRFGYTALCADCGREGIRIFQERKADIDLVLLDLNMPGMSGEETYTALREISEDIPVVIFSGYIAPSIQENLESKGIRGFIHKPFKNMDLLLQIRNVLDT